MPARIIALLLCLLFFLDNGFSQSNEKDTLQVRGSLFVELLGNSLTWSGNIDYFIYRDPVFGIATRFGGGYTPGDWLCCRWNLVVGLNTVFGMPPNHFELGISNLTVQEIHEIESKNYLGFLIGYRYQPRRNGILFKASFTPFYSDSEFLGRIKLPIAPFAGVSIGWSY